MRKLTSVEEFMNEAPNALYNKQQAVIITLRLLEKEYNSVENSENEKTVLRNAMKRSEFRYLDMTQTHTDSMLDALGVARFTTADIVKAIDEMVFDVE